MKLVPAALALGLVVASGVAAHEEPRGSVLYVTIDSINGESKDPGHENQIRGFHYSETWRASTNWTSGGGASVGKPMLGPAVFTKESGKASLQLKRNIAIGKSMAKATFEFYDVAHDGSMQLTYKIVFQAVFVVAVNEKTIDGKVLDEIQLVFRDGRWETFDPPEVFEFNVVTGVANVTAPARSNK
jgi:type VI secretion system Hcp family effector